MNKIKNLILFFSIFLLFPSVFAEMNIELQEKSVYNLGEKIVPSVSIKENEAYNGFVKINLGCDDYEMQYYTSPLSIESAIRTQVLIPELTLTRTMVGQCNIKASFDKDDGTKISSASSKDFEVTSKLNIEIDNILRTKPGENLIFSADIDDANNEPLQKGIAEIIFQKNSYEDDINSGVLVHELVVDYALESGRYPLNIIVKDDNNNYGSKSITLEILQTPVRIEHKMQEAQLYPGSSLKATLVLYDHVAKPIAGEEIEVKIYDENEDLLGQNTIKSTKNFEVKIDSTFAPGTYSLVSNYGELEETSTFIIEELEKISMEYQENVIKITNIGNVDYGEETTIILEEGEKKRLINKKLNLKPGEIFEIDLSKEVPTGTYAITLPEEYVGIDVNGNDVTRTNTLLGVNIQDQRSAVQKTFQGLSGITGAVVEATKTVVSKPKLASAIMITLILGIITFYSRDFIIQKVKKEKPESTDHMFEDFDYQQEKK